MLLFKEKEFVEEEQYIDEDNDPQKVEEIRKEDYTLIEKEEVIEFDEVFETVRTKIHNLSNYDHIREERVLDSLRKGKFRK